MFGREPQGRALEHHLRLDRLIEIKERITALTIAST